MRYYRNLGDKGKKPLRQQFSRKASSVPSSPTYLRYCQPGPPCLWLRGPLLSDVRMVSGGDVSFLVGNPIPTHRRQRAWWLGTSEFISHESHPEEAPRAGEPKPGSVQLSFRLSSLSSKHPAGHLTLSYLVALCFDIFSEF